MECTVCGNNLVEITVGAIAVDVCQDGCGGIWFDRFELAKVDEPHETEGEALLSIRRDKALKVDHDQRRRCPRCLDVIMMRHFFSVKRAVEVDECPQCAGTWLDFGELGQIRKEFGSEEDRREAALDHCAEALGEELTRMGKAGEKGTGKSKTILRLVRFLGR